MPAPGPVPVLAGRDRLLRVESLLLLRLLLFSALLVCGTVFGQTSADGALVPPVPEPDLEAVGIGNPGEDVSPFVFRQQGMMALERGSLDQAIRAFSLYRERSVGDRNALADATALVARVRVMRCELGDALAVLDEFAEGAGEPVPEEYVAALTYWRAAAVFWQGRTQDAILLLRGLVGTVRSREYRAATLRLLADAYVRTGRTVEAESLLQRMLRENAVDTDRASAYLGLIDVALARGRVELAGEYLSTLRSGEFPLSAAELGPARIRVALASGDVGGAVAVYRELEAVRPRRPDFLWWDAAMGLVDALVAAEDYRTALDVLPGTVMFAPTAIARVQAQLRRGECLLAVRQTAVAADLLTELFTADPELPDLFPLLLRLAQQVREADPAGAAVYFGRVSEAAAAPARLRYEAAFGLAECLEQTGQLERAVTTFARAAELATSPEAQAQSLMSAGAAARRAGQFTSAALYYQQVADNYKHTAFAADARFTQAEVRARAGRHGNAATVYEQFLTEYPEDARFADARLLRGLALRDAGSHGLAARELLAFGEAYPESPRAPGALAAAADAALTARDTDLALQVLGRIVDRYGDSEFFAPALHRRARIHFLQADYVAGLADADAYLLRFPGLPQAVELRMRVADYHANAGQVAEARSAYLAVVNEHPRAAAAPVALFEAAVLARSGEGVADVCAGLCRQLLAEYPDAPPELRSRATLLLAGALSEVGEVAEAAELLRGPGEAQDVTPALRNGARLLLGWICLRHPDTGDADATLATLRAVARDPGATACHALGAGLLTAEMLAGQGRIDDARYELWALVLQGREQRRAGARPEVELLQRAGLRLLELTAPEARSAVEAQVKACLDESGIPALPAATPEWDVVEAALFSGTAPGTGLDLDRPEVLREKGLWLFQRGAPDLAARFFDAWRQVVSEDSQALIAACGLGARAYFAAGDREGAAAVLDAWAGAEGADTAEVNLWQGLLHMTREQWQDAAEVLRDLPGKLTTRPLRMLSFELAAEACVHVGDLAAASFFLSEALSRSPAPDVRWRLIRQAALIQLAHGGAAEAERLLALLQEGVNAMAQADLELYGVLGLVGGGQAGPALDRFRPASAPPAGQASPALVWVTGNELAKALTAREEWSLAAEVWRQIAATAPSRGAGRDAALRAVDCLRAAGKTADAAAELEKVRAAYPDVADEPAMLVQLAALRTDLGRGEDAFALLERVRAQEDAPAVLRYRAACAMGLQARAEEDYGRAVDLLLSAEELSATPEDRALVLMLAADSCASLGDHVRAAKIYERAASAAGTQSVQERAIYNLAVSRTGARLYSAAVDAYTTYLERWPQAVNAGAVRFERGVALRLAGESGRAVSELTALADLLEDPAVAARALLEASAAASDAGDSAVAVQLLARLLHDYPDSALRAQALYQRARISFFQGRHQEAVNDCRRFLEEMPEHPLAADVLMWLGAHFARVERDLDSSEAYYLQLAGQHGNAPEAPLALYQAARNAYERGRFTDTEGHVVRLFSEFPDAPGRIRALAALLLGDVLAAGGEYAAAAPYFRSAAAAADSEAGVAAASWGRLGDMYYSMAQGDPEQLDEAISCYERVLGDPLAPRDLREMARYRLAKALEKRDRIERAIQEYGELVWGYAEDRGSAGIEDWYYFARSVYDVTNLLVLERRFHEAVRAYERLARADTPFSEDAGERARELREAHNLLE